MGGVHQYSLGWLYLIILIMLIFFLSHLNFFTRTFTSSAATRETNNLQTAHNLTILEAKLSQKLCLPLLVEGFAGGLMVCMRRSKLLTSESCEKK